MEISSRTKNIAQISLILAIVLSITAVTAHINLKNAFAGTPELTEQINSAQTAVSEAEVALEATRTALEAAKTPVTTADPKWASLTRTDSLTELSGVASSTEIDALKAAILEFKAAYADLAAITAGITGAESEAKYIVYKQKFDAVKAALAALSDAEKSVVNDIATFNLEATLNDIALNFDPIEEFFAAYDPDAYEIALSVAIDNNNKAKYQLAYNISALKHAEHAFAEYEAATAEADVATKEADVATKEAAVTAAEEGLAAKEATLATLTAGGAEPADIATAETDVSVAQNVLANAQTDKATADTALAAATQTAADKRAEANTKLGELNEANESLEQVRALLSEEDQTEINVNPVFNVDAPTVNVQGASVNNNIDVNPEISNNVNVSPAIKVNPNIKVYNNSSAKELAAVRKLIESNNAESKELRKLISALTSTIKSMNERTEATFGMSNPLIKTLKVMEYKLTLKSLNKQLEEKESKGSKLNKTLRGAAIKKEGNLLGVPQKAKSSLDKLKKPPTDDCRLGTEYCSMVSKSKVRTKKRLVAPKKINKKIAQSLKNVTRAQFVIELYKAKNAIDESKLTMEDYISHDNLAKFADISENPQFIPFANQLGLDFFKSNKILKGKSENSFGVNDQINIYEALLIYAVIENDMNNVKKYSHLKDWKSIYMNYVNKDLYLNWHRDDKFDTVKLQQLINLVEPIKQPGDKKAEAESMEQLMIEELMKNSN